jgi:hypothetical protein
MGRLWRAKKEPRHEPGLASLNAVITVRHLLREEKQGMRPCGVSFRINYRGDAPIGVVDLSEKTLQLLVFLPALHSFTDSRWAFRA